MAPAYSLAFDAPLRERNTLRVEARAHCLATVTEAAALPALLADPAVRDLPLLILGEGSNVLFATPRFDGLIVHLACADVRIEAADDASAVVFAEAACGWDALVDWTLDRGLGGLENLALIPGQVGAAPIQNIGAYGVEVREFITRVEAFDLREHGPVTLPGERCGFGYRDSIFKREAGRWIVTGVALRLPKHGRTNLGYAGLREELVAMGASGEHARDVAEAVRRVRRRKLPDPRVVGNAGSFFKNPVVHTSVAASLRARFDDLPVYPSGDGPTRKLSAAWLIERAGWRGYREGDAGISAQHALVLVNHGTATGAELLAVARSVARSVEETFGVKLEPEPRIVGADFR